MPPPQRPYRDSSPSRSTDELNASFSSPQHDGFSSARSSTETTSTTSLILERINQPDRTLEHPETKETFSEDEDAYDDVEMGRRRSRRNPIQGPMSKSVRRSIYILGGLLIGGWLLALGIYLSTEAYKSKDTPHDSSASVTPKAGLRISLDQVLDGAWRPRTKSVVWADGEKDGLMLVTGSSKGYVEVRDINDESYSRVLMKHRDFVVGGKPVQVAKYWPSPDLKRLLLATDLQSHWRHSFTGRYWILDVATQMVEPLVPGDENRRLMLAVWSPKSDAVAFVTDNNIYVRSIQDGLTQITKDGGTDVFYGVPDWVYEEEVFSGNTALWWSPDGSGIAFLRTDEKNVPDYPLQYFASRPSGEQPREGLEYYPELDFIKYPKAGAPNPVVHLQYWDAERSEIFSVDTEKDFPDSDRLITEVLWAGPSKVLIRETNRESDVERMVLVNVKTRTGKVIREIDVNGLDGGWFEVSQKTVFIPADPEKGRQFDGYVDQIIVDGYNHLAYFTPPENDQPILLTKGTWEVVDAPSAVDLENNLVYFASTEKSSIERHFYSVKLDGTDRKPITDVSKDGYYDISFSRRATYALVSYRGPDIPYQKMISTPVVGQNFSMPWSSNEGLEELAKKHELPTFHYSTVNIDGFDLNVVERRPPHFNPEKKYPVLFYVYGGPGSQMVTKRFGVDFQAYAAGGLDYVVVTVDGRGTGFTGRKSRTAVRGNLGFWESHDQIETAKLWGQKSYVDEERMAIWGWSYGGFMTLKTLEQDAGRTFKYGMAVAPVTDWRFYDSIYTERYMHTPQRNPAGYENSTISNVQALSQSVRFLVMHGTADDNVHIQNTLALIDKLDLGDVENYDVHFYPDSDHSIYFHNANRMVYGRLAQWITRAFNGEFLRLDGLKPIDQEKASVDPDKKLE